MLRGIWRTSGDDIKDDLGPAWIKAGRRHRDGVDRRAPHFLAFRGETP